ncbi:MAG TPA: hypothetical protein EYG22_03955 [Candidatus Thioglobus sp.]|nr:hypothetical protein [Candidatus Thioglobus sp.]
MKIPERVMSDTLNYFRTNTVFPAWMDGMVAQALQSKLDGGLTWHEATEETLNEIQDGVLL